ncbi:uncharacterized protein PITG_09658 [Phytophthora infestans T30-4]|uniref:EF-hand domain-containing protein n=1 Tax=Phytophthora infestans (strain T30-4) TaxID=403677 RepID=D0NCI2_PHYIT|nr:uncharacterized protein PITG_09658 [Phytophthora infestans T30-4]EEY55696.1 conserved hypothetical protein [Phytophthora infestans T30-4]|eukprot:XP_002903272.1 conserved hypothetical protein [Phytophthora infestans T30-4]
MWRPAFSTLKCEKALECSRRLLNNNTLLFKLVRWFNFRVEHDRVQLNCVDIRDTEASLDSKSTSAKWQSQFHTVQTAFRLADKDCSGEIDADEARSTNTSRNSCVWWTRITATWCRSKSSSRRWRTA